MATVSLTANTVSTSTVQRRKPPCGVWVKVINHNHTNLNDNEGEISNYNQWSILCLRRRDGGRREMSTNQPTVVRRTPVHVTLYRSTHGRRATSRFCRERRRCLVCQRHVTAEWQARRNNSVYGRWQAQSVCEKSLCVCRASSRRPRYPPLNANAHRDICQPNITMNDVRRQTAASEEMETPYVTTVMPVQKRK